MEHGWHFPRTQRRLEIVHTSTISFFLGWSSPRLNYVIRNWSNISYVNQFLWRPYLALIMIIFDMTTTTSLIVAQSPSVKHSIFLVLYFSTDCYWWSLAVMQSSVTFMILCDYSYHNQSIYSSVSISKTQSLANCSSLAERNMDMIKNIPVHMDYVGQGRAEKLYQVCITSYSLSIYYFISTRSSLSSLEWLASAGVIRSSSSLRR